MSHLSVLMEYAVIAIVVLLALGLIGRRISRRLQPASFPASDLLRRPSEDASIELPEAHAAEPSGTHGTTVKLQSQDAIAAPGAPNTDISTDRHVTERGSATVTRRIGRRRSTTSSQSAQL